MMGRMRGPGAKEASSADFLSAAWEFQRLVLNHRRSHENATVDFFFLIKRAAQSRKEVHIHLRHRPRRCGARIRGMDAGRKSSPP